MAGTLVAVFLAAAAWLLLRPGRYPARGRETAAGRLGLETPGANSHGSTGIADPALMLDLVAAMLDAGQSLLPALGVLADVVEPETALCLRRVQAALELGAPWAVAWELADAGRPGARFRPSGSGPKDYRRRSPRRSGLQQLGSPQRAPQQRAPREAAPQRPEAPAAQLREALTFVATTGAPSAAVLLAAAAQVRRRRSREAERRAAALGVKLVVPLGLCALPAFVILTVVPLLLSLLPSFP